MKNLAIAVLLALTCSLYANAQYISEIKQSFSNQTALLSASSILSAPGSDASYLICSYLTTAPASAGTLYTVLRWTDENGVAQSNTLSPAAAGSTGGCLPIRNEANTAPTIETDGTYSQSYSLLVTGLGFWPIGAMKQGGLTEPFAQQFSSQTGSIASTQLSSSSTYAQYLVALTVAPSSDSNCGSSDAVTVTLNWTDDLGAQQASSSAYSGSANCYPVSLVLPIRVKATSSVYLSTSATVVYPYNVTANAVQFGTPASGSGPLTPYLSTRLNDTHADCYVFPTGQSFTSLFPGVTSPTATLLAANLSETPGEGGDYLSLSAYFIDGSGNEWGLNPSLLTYGYGPASGVMASVGGAGGYFVLNSSGSCASAATYSVEALAFEF